MLSRLIYKSRRKPNCGAEEIDKILESAQKNNAKVDVTGVLLYDRQHFIQCLEGPSDKITSLYDHIKQDSRHHQVHMIAYGPSKGRVFPAWAMGGKSMEGESLQIISNLSEEDRRTFEQILVGEEISADRAMSLVQKFAQA